MSTRKRTYAELTQPSASYTSSSSQQTPSRPGYAPSTPHAIRALQQRSGNKLRSAARSARKAINKGNDLPRPDSARGVLKRLAQLESRRTQKRVVTPAGKENEPEEEEEDDDDDEQHDLRKPGLTLPIDESIEEEDSELPIAPTPSVLPDEDDYDSTMTFRAIDFARHSNARRSRPSSEKIDRRSRSSFPAEGNEVDEDEDADLTADITAEIGRRAVSEGPPTERFPRHSFGSIRMSQFGTELEIRRESETQSGRRSELFDQFPNGSDAESDGDMTRDIDAETANLRRLQRSPSRLSEHDLSTQMPNLGDDEDTFRLDMPNDEQGSGNESDAEEPDAEGNIETQRSDSLLFEPQSPPKTRKQTPLETAATVPPRRRRKALKMTRHGTTIPSLPSSLIRRIAIKTQTRLGKRKPKLGREHMKALEQATEWFFEQVGEDLAAYSSHAGRKKRIDQTDVELLMKRQKICREDGELKALAEEWLPKEVLNELDLPENL